MVVGVSRVENTETFFRGTGLKKKMIVLIIQFLLFICSEANQIVKYVSKYIFCFLVPHVPCVQSGGC